MIQIKLTKDQHKHIENKHWEWFKENKAKDFAKKISEDDVLLSYFFQNEDQYIMWERNEYENKEDRYKGFKKLIIGNIDEINNIIADIDNIKNLRGKNYIYKNADWFQNQYENFRGRIYKKGNWGGTTLVQSLDLRTCPYCNRNFIDTYKIGKNNEIKTNAQLDHFFPKEKYPYLAISLYNLIPCCAQCNHIKSNRIDEIVYPYSKTINDAISFKIDFIEDTKDIVEVLYGKSNNFNIKISLNNIDNNMKNNIEVFKLDKLYQNHKEHVKDLMKKSIVYDESMITELYKQYPHLFKDELEIKESIFNTYRSSEDFNKSPLSKLNYDISKDLGINI